MSAKELTKEQLADYKKQLLEAVPKTGSIGNKALRSKLKWDQAAYWRVRNQLINEGQLEKGRGQGGSVHRVALQPSPDSAAGSRALAALPEAHLYEPVLKTIKSAWVKEYRSDESVAEITARQGRKETGGKWTRPDITLATFSAYPFVPGKHFDVTTFEIKKHDALDVTIVYEALAHRRAAHYAYVLIHVPEDRKESVDETLENLAYEASQHGVGFVVLSDPDDYDTWDVWEDGERHEPDPSDLNDFLATQMSPSFKNQLTRWFKF